MAALSLPATLRLESPTALIDSREQAPLCLDPLKVKIATFATGDYSLRGLEHVVEIERKSLVDLIGCVGRERERFDREVQPLLAFPVRTLLVEATWADIEAGDWRCKVTPAQVEGSLLGWIASGLQVELIGSHERAERFPAKNLFAVARRRYRELRTLVPNGGGDA